MQYLTILSDVFDLQPRWKRLDGRSNLPSQLLTRVPSRRIVFASSCKKRVSLADNYRHSLRRDIFNRRTDARLGMLSGFFSGKEHRAVPWKSKMFRNKRPNRYAVNRRISVRMVLIVPPLSSHNRPGQIPSMGLLPSSNSIEHIFSRFYFFCIVIHRAQAAGRPRDEHGEIIVVVVEYQRIYFTDLRTASVLF